MKRALACLLALLLHASASHALTVLPVNDADLLAQAIIGPGITLVPGSATYTGAEGAAGFFTGGHASGIGIESGVLLTTGQATNMGRSKDAGSEDASNGQPGDPRLDALVDPNLTYDAAVLHFLFSTNGGDLFVNFIFGSNEYNEWVDTGYNDVFGFFMNGENLATVPGTNLPVSINSVNALRNSELFFDNSYDTYYDTNPPYDINLEGFTRVLTAGVTNLEAGVYEMAFAIADTSDDAFDSVVFIQASTFSDKFTNNPVPEPATVVLLGGGLIACLAGRRLRKTA